jgi:carbon-monoxide dehydrogenase small subunit
MAEHYTLHVNGEAREVTDAWVGESLLHVLRERLELRGTKGACEQGECGSCSVLVDDRLVCSCLTLAATSVGRRIVTVEGVQSDASAQSAHGENRSGALTDVQRAFVEAGAVQCGFCTPGLVMAVHALVDGRAPGDAPTEDEIRERLSGNICRCTGYGRIMEAVRVVVRQRLGEVAR